MVCGNRWLAVAAVAEHAFQTQEGYTALMSAAFYGRMDCLRLLLEGGSDKEAKDNVR